METKKEAERDLSKWLKEKNPALFEKAIEDGFITRPDEPKDIVNMLPKEVQPIAKYAIIKTEESSGYFGATTTHTSTRIHLYKGQWSGFTPSRDKMIFEPIITIQNNFLTITGKQIPWFMGSFLGLKEWIYGFEMWEKEKAAASHGTYPEYLEEGYRSIWDKLKGKKTFFISTWYPISKTLPFTMETTDFKIFHEN